jgi:hypothetical protein
MNALVIDRISSPILSAIPAAHPPAGGRGDGRLWLAPALAAGIGLREAAATMLLRCGLCRPDVATRPMGHVERWDGRRCVVEGARTPERAAWRAQPTGRTRPALVAVAGIQSRNERFVAIALVGEHNDLVFLPRAHPRLAQLEVTVRRSLLPTEAYTMLPGRDPQTG